MSVLKLYGFSLVVESWFLVQFEDQPDTFRVLNEREVKHLDPEDYEEMQEGETIQAFWSANKKFYKAEIIKISDDKSYLLKERRALETSLRKSALGKALASDDKSAKKRLKKAQKQPSVFKKVKLTDEEKAKQEAKKAKQG
ncbi:hypothetical protein P5673_015024 [Acropora cervicornis]|uniref:Uncharacterized protein n=1 Tax=Acropora cervicornis TaxID=6130 RepID=A0AAD9QHY6_ACRCE|nr:hypothetical protein P5673_015024 [Acropora cervicornis]